MTPGKALGFGAILCATAYAFGMLVVNAFGA